MARTTKVVRPGQTKPHKTRLVAKRPPARADIVVGIVGLLLLAVSFWLVDYLLEEEPELRQWQLNIDDSGQRDLESQVAFLNENTEHTFTFDVTEPNTHQIILTTIIRDDVPASHPDVFELRLLDPQGVARGNATISTGPPVFDDDPINGTFDFTSPAVQTRLTFRALGGDTPQPTIVKADGDETVEEAEARLLPGVSRDMSGTWSVEVTLRQAGDCPIPAADASTILRIADCQSDTQGEGDAANPFTLALVTVSWYTPFLTELE